MVKIVCDKKEELDALVRLIAFLRDDDIELVLSSDEKLAAIDDSDGEADTPATTNDGKGANNSSDIVVDEGLGRFTEKGETGASGETVSVPVEKILDGVADVEFLGFPNKEIFRAKVDTGATMSSLDASNIKITGPESSMVTFNSKILGDKQLSMAVQGVQSVQSVDGGIQYRPVVRLSAIKVNGELLTDVDVNLADRSAMTYPMLIGLDVIKQGKFVVQPKTNVE